MDASGSAVELRLSSGGLRLGTGWIRFRARLGTSFLATLLALLKLIPHVNS